MLKVRDGAPPVRLQGLVLDDERQVIVEGGTVDIAGCHFGSSSGSAGRRLAEGRAVRALLISGGEVTISRI